MNKQLKEFKEVLDKLGIENKEISMSHINPEKTHIETSLSLRFGYGFRSKLEIEHCQGGGKQKAIKLCRTMILQLNDKVRQLADKLAEIQNETGDKK